MASVLESSITVSHSSVYRNSTLATTTTAMASPVRVTKIGSCYSDFRGLKMQCPKRTLTYSTRRQQRFVVNARVSPVDEEKWDSLVLKSSSPLVLIFLVPAHWCKQSRHMKPIVDQISNNYEEDLLRCFALDVKKSGPIPMRYGFQTPPIIVFFMSGEKKGEIQGQTTEEELNEKIQELLSQQD